MQKENEKWKKIKSNRLAPDEALVYLRLFDGGSPETLAEDLLLSGLKVERILGNLRDAGLIDENNKVQQETPVSSKLAKKLDKETSEHLRLLIAAVDESAKERGVFITKSAWGRWTNVFKRLLAESAYDWFAIRAGVKKYADMLWPLDYPEAFLRVVNRAVEGTLRKCVKRGTVAPHVEREGPEGVESAKSAWRKEKSIVEVLEEASGYQG